MLFFVQNLGFSQINVGNNSYAMARVKSGRLPEELLRELKTTTTLFVVREKDKNKLDDFKIALQNTWSFNQLKIINQNELKKYEGKPGYSFITSEGYLNTGTNDLVNFFLEYWTFVYKDGEKKKQTIAVIELYPDNESQTSLLRLRYEDALIQLPTVVNDIADFFNFTPGLVKCYMKCLNNKLLDAQPHSLIEKESLEESLYQLKKDTLFLPEYILKSGITDVQIKENYSFGYKILDQAAFDIKILKSKGNLYILSYVFVNKATKYITVFNVRTGEILYSFNTMESDSNKPITGKDFNKLSKVIKSAI
jgi:hypothetical protein